MQIIRRFCWYDRDTYPNAVNVRRYQAKGFFAPLSIWVPMLMMVILLGGCQSMQEPGGLRSLFKKVELKANSYLNTYEKSEHEFDAGRVMEAHATVLGMDKTRPDYPQARDFFDKEVEPARKKLLHYYLNKADLAEKNKQWAQAADFYEQAASFAPEDLELAMQAREIRLRMRQMRFNALLQQRRKEDREIITWMEGYEPPPGLDFQDEIYLRKRENYQDWIGNHARNSLREAKRHFRKSEPELAYIELESFLRFRPGDIAGENMLEEAKSSIPQGLSIEIRHFQDEKLAASQADLVSSEQYEIKLIEAEEIETLIEQKHWSLARKQALAYRRQGGENSEEYLAEIAEHTAREASSAFRKGSILFRRERLDEAVEQWQRAAELEPDNAEYSEQLSRALRMQERLRVIRQEAGENSDEMEQAENGT